MPTANPINKKQVVLNKFSYFLNVLIIFYLMLCFSVLFFGGFQTYVFGKEFSATTLVKPLSILSTLYLLKLFIADKKNKVEQNLLLIFGTIILIVLVGELFSRAYYNFFSPKTFEDATRELALPRKGKTENLRFIDVAKINPNLRLPYELRPDLIGIYEGKSILINSAGIRDDHEITIKKEHAFRIVGIGDSVMFGQGVEFKNSYGEILEKKLGSLLGGKKIEFINLAVPGYNTTMEVETFIKKGTNYKPDLVIIGFVGNDLEMPYFIAKKESAIFSNKSFLSFYLTKRMDTLFATLGYNPNKAFWRNKKSDLGLVNLQHAMWMNKSLDFIPEEYKFMVGLKAYTREIKNLKNKCDEIGVPLIIVYDDEMVKNEGYTKNSFVKKLAGKLNIPFVDVFKESEEFLNKNKLKLVDLHLSEGDRHPNKKGHLIRGNKLASFIFSNFFSTP
jgi:lysophospholipase L1-like esterase